MTAWGTRRVDRTGGRALLLITMLVRASTAAAQALPDLPFEDLFKLDGGQVFGASQRLQPAMEAPASISFITAAEIRRNGYRTLADILRSVRGMYVTDDRNFSYVGVRGFGKPGDYNSRILLLINGHRVNDNIFGGAWIGEEGPLDPAMFERVEVIRGPASSIYGDSAFFAVVNVITRTGASLAGGSLTVETGTLGTRLARGAVGRRLANGVDIAASGTYEQSDGEARLYFPAFDSPATNRGVAEGLDGERLKQAYGRLEFKGLTVTGAYSNRHKDVPSASLGTLFNQHESREQTTDRHTLADAEYQQSFHDTQVTFRASFDQFSVDVILPLTLAPSGLLVAHSATLGNRWSAGTQFVRAFGGQTVTGGVELIDNVHQDQSSQFVDPPVPLLDIRRSSVQSAIYGQDEIKLATWLVINAGLRYDGYEDFRRVSPRAALIVLPSSTQSVKYLYGRAFRAPNAYELNSFYFGPRVEQLRPEAIDTHEIVWERYVNNWLRTSVSTYWYHADELITGIVDGSTRSGASYANGGQVSAKGVELEGQVRFRGTSRLVASYALQAAQDVETHADVPNSPRHMVKARINLSGPIPRSLVSLEGQYLSSRETLIGSHVAPVATLDVTLIQTLAPSWELFGGVRNLFDAQYADPASSQHRQDAIPQNGRTAQLGVRWILAAQQPNARQN